MKPKVLFVTGTRPEAVKIAPIVRCASEYPVHPVLLTTGQHADIVDSIFDDFEVVPDIRLDLQRKGTGLAELTSQLVVAIDKVLEDESPDMVVVQGDTSSVAFAGLVAFYRKIPVAHVEAGLRSYDKFHPFPEEINRKVVSAFADLNFVPTPLAKQNLLKENVSEDSVVVTGNTVVDAVNHIKAGLQPPPDDGVRRVLVTTHRRENWDNSIANICEAIKSIVQAFPDVEVTLPVHPNPIVFDQIHELLGTVGRVNLTAPMGYKELQYALSASHLVLTDSGGIQEEAPTYGKPVLVLREVTERPEAVMAGQSKIVGTDKDVIIKECTTLLTDDAAYKAMADVANPFGDGLAGERIMQAMVNHLNGLPLAEGMTEFGE